MRFSRCSHTVFVIGKYTKIFREIFRGAEFSVLRTQYREVIFPRTFPGETLHEGIEGGVLAYFKNRSGILL